jgi:hypothetical protein
VKRSTSRARSKPPKIQWVEQVEDGGCSRGCLAMLLGVTYARIVELTPGFCGRCGIHDDSQVFQVLADHGFAVQQVWPYTEYSDANRTPWPPKAFAPVHICSVTQTKQDFYGHYVCMDSKGVVYDPALPEFQPRALSDYHDVEWVAGCWEVGVKP